MVRRLRFSGDAGASWSNIGQTRKQKTAPETQGQSWPPQELTMDAYAWFTYAAMADILRATTFLGKRGKAFRKRCLFHPKSRKKRQTSAMTNDSHGEDRK
jgi:hypothetical protein